MSTPTISPQYTFLMGQRVKVIHYPLTPVDTETYIGDCGRVDHYYDTSQGIRYYQVRLDELGATRTFLPQELIPEPRTNAYATHTLTAYRQHAEKGKQIRVERTTTIQGIVVSSDEQTLRVKLDGGMVYTYFYDEGTNPGVGNITIVELPDPEPVWVFGHVVIDKMGQHWARGSRDLWYRIGAGYQTRTDEEMMRLKPLKVIGEPIKNED